MTQLKRKPGRPACTKPADSKVVYIRALSTQLHGEVKMYARRNHLSMGEAYTHLLTRGLLATAD